MKLVLQVMMLIVGIVHNNIIKLRINIIQIELFVIIMICYLEIMNIKIRLNSTEHPELMSDVWRCSCICFVSNCWKILLWIVPLHNTLYSIRPIPQLTTTPLAGCKGVPGQSSRCAAFHWDHRHRNQAWLPYH